MSTPAVCTLLPPPWRTLASSGSLRRSRCTGQLQVCIPAVGDSFFGQHTASVPLNCAHMAVAEAVASLQPCMPMTWQGTVIMSGTEYVTIAAAQPKGPGYAGIQDWPGDEPVLAAAFEPRSQQLLAVDYAAMLAVPSHPTALQPPAAPQTVASPAGSPSEWDLDAVMVKPEPSYTDIGKESYTFFAGAGMPLLALELQRLPASSSVS